MATKTREISDFLAEGAADLPIGKPHITPGVLYPAVFGKLLDGTTNHSNAYGTAQSDGHSYYYTDIKGSKPIKDPRIGAHFGSQRHQFTSVQQLEQETATHGKAVFSLDGREWCRFVNGSTSSTVSKNNAYGAHLEIDSSKMSAAGDVKIEVVGYFNFINLITINNTDHNNIRHRIDGGSWVQNDIGSISVTDAKVVPRFVHAGSVENLSIGTFTTPAIHTIEIENYDGSNHFVIESIELIVQDTTSTATKSQIQIPSQNVVSYGKKFSLSATAQHYNPFATKGDGSASTIPNNTTGDSVATGWSGSTSAYWESTLDTATSLGLGAWEAGSTVYYRPVNGGRIVKWVDSTGTIKTSVNMMPPEAHSITEVNTIADGTAAATGTHNWSTQYQPQFGHKTVGSNLITSWATTSDAVETLDSTGANITQFTNSTGWGTATTNDLGLTVGRLYKIQISNYDHTSGVGLRIFTGTNGTSANGTIGVTNLTNDTPSSHTFRAGTSDTKLSLGVQSEAAAAADTINFTLYEVEEPSLQADVAKFYHFAEFGNGSANKNATYQDWTDMGILSNKTPAYIMDDGLTSLSGNVFKMATANSGTGTGGVYIYNATENVSAYYLTFIGTGVSIRAEITTAQPQGTTVVAQNLPYGTHIMRVFRTSSHYASLWIDGVQIINNDTKWTNFWYPAEFIIHQPKMPPIPDDACIISDYMLMADFVKQTDIEPSQISKGVRALSGTRDVFYNCAAAVAEYSNIEDGYLPFGYEAIASHSSNVASAKLPFFGTNAISLIQASDGAHTIDFAGSSNVAKTALDSSVNAKSDGYSINTAATLGLNEVTTNILAGGYGWQGYYLATPIHTSSHYQTFETPYLHELLGGDRNMEQTNLVVTADGKTWDEVTRDTSYISDGTKVVTTSSDEISYNSPAVLFDKWRGTQDAKEMMTKDFAIAHDRLICLVDGIYHVSGLTLAGATETTIVILKNGTDATYTYAPTNDEVRNFETTVSLIRGDYIQLRGEFGHGPEKYNLYTIRKT